jgi:nitrogen fixation NifU-like protein
MEYSDKILKHFFNPQNCGEIENPDGVGEIGSVECGDYFKFMVKIENNIITDVKYKVFGCGAAIGLCSIVSELAKNKSVDDALKITDETAVQEAGGLPEVKFHCSNYAASALHKAIQNYLNR